MFVRGSIALLIIEDQLLKRRLQSKEIPVSSSGLIFLGKKLA